MWVNFVILLKYHYHVFGCTWIATALPPKPEGRDTPLLLPVTPPGCACPQAESHATPVNRGTKSRYFSLQKQTRAPTERCW